jgi:hypothetical protein
MANKAKRFLLSFIMLAAIFAYSCGSGGPSYYAMIAKANWISYTTLYPDATMNPGGYFLNEMAQYGGYQYGEDICNYYIDNLSEDERNSYISQAGGRDYAIAYCIRNNEQDHFHENNIENIKDRIKSANTPYYDAINREIFVRGNYKFLGFYQVDEQVYYILVSFTPGE